MNTYKLKIAGDQYEVKILSRDENMARLAVNGNEVEVEILPDERKVSKTPKLSRPSVAADTVAREPSTVRPSADKGAGVVKAPLPGSIFKLAVKVGDEVKAGQMVLIMEAMKMENEIHCAVGGTVKDLRVKEGDSVLEGDTLLVIE